MKSCLVFSKFKGVVLLVMMGLFSVCLLAHLSGIVAPTSQLSTTIIDTQTDTGQLLAAIDDTQGVSPHSSSEQGPSDGDWQQACPNSFNGSDVKVYCQNMNKVVCPDKSGTSPNKADPQPEFSCCQDSPGPDYPHGKVYADKNKCNNILKLQFPLSVSEGLKSCNFLTHGEVSLVCYKNQIWHLNSGSMLATCPDKMVEPLDPCALPTPT